MPNFLRDLSRALFGLQFRTTILLSGLVLAATSLTSGMHLKVASRVTIQEASRHARELAKAIAAACSHHVENDDRPALVDIARRMVPEGELNYVFFTDRTGFLLAGFQKGQGNISGLMLDDQRMSVQPMNRPTLRTDGKTGPGIDLVYPVTAILGEVEPSSKPDPNQQVTIGYVRLGLSLNEAGQTLAQNVQRVAGVAVGITLLMVPLGFELVRRIIRPINHLSDAAAKLAGGDLTIRVPEERRDEIGDLSRSFNAMSGELARSHDQLVRLNSELEHRVRERTRQLEDLNSQLREEISEKEAFVRTVSHDLAAPLRNVNGMADVLRRKQGESLTSDAAHCLDRIQHNIRQELELIDELLELSQIQSDDGPSLATDVADLVDGVVKQLEFELSKKNIRIIVGDGLPRICCDRRRLRQLLQNLIDNAIKYTDSQRLLPGQAPDIRITCNERSRDYLIRVADHGIGIDPAESDRIFHVFRRSANQFVSHVAGKGVGLSACKSIVQKFGGRIWVESNPGGGSVFCFTLAKAVVGPRVDDLESARVGSTREPALAKEGGA